MAAKATKKKTTKKSPARKNGIGNFLRQRAADKLTGKKVKSVGQVLRGKLADKVRGKKNPAKKRNMSLPPLETPTKYVLKMGTKLVDEYSKLDTAKAEAQYIANKNGRIVLINTMKRGFNGRYALEGQRSIRPQVANPKAKKVKNPIVAASALATARRMVLQGASRAEVVAYLSPHVSGIREQAGARLFAGQAYDSWTSNHPKVAIPARRNPKKRKQTRRNPQVEAVYEMFQGRASGETFTEFVPKGTPKDVAAIGYLVSFILRDNSGERYEFKYEDTGDGLPWLTADARSNLYIAGAKFSHLNVTGNIGHVETIAYVTAKEHIGNGKTYEYVHRFGEEGGKEPKFFIDNEGGGHLKGGSYILTAEGIRD